MSMPSSRRRAPSRAGELAALRRQRPVRPPAREPGLVVLADRMRLEHDLECSSALPVLVRARASAASERPDPRTVSGPSRHAEQRKSRITLVSYVGPVPGRGGRAAHDQARGGRSDRHDALARPRQGAGGRQGDPQDHVQVRGPFRADEPGGVPVLPGPRARRRHPGRDDGSEPATCARSTRCSRTRCRCSKPSTRWPRSGSRTPRSTACSTGALRTLAERRSPLVTPAFFWKLLSLEGVHPMLDGCARCGLDGDDGRADRVRPRRGRHALPAVCARRGPGGHARRARPAAAHARRRPERRARRSAESRVARGRAPRDPGARAPRRAAPALHRAALTS